MSLTSLAIEERHHAVVEQIGRREASCDHSAWTLAWYRRRSIGKPARHIERILGAAVTRMLARELAMRLSIAVLTSLCSGANEPRAPYCPSQRGTATSAARSRQDPLRHLTQFSGNPTTRVRLRAGLSAGPLSVLREHSIWASRAPPTAKRVPFIPNSKRVFLEPAAGVEHHICQLLTGCSTIELHRPKASHIIRGPHKHQVNHRNSNSSMLPASAFRAEYLQLGLLRRLKWQRRTPVTPRAYTLGFLF
jgi:hypothetical protein